MLKSRTLTTEIREQIEAAIVQEAFAERTAELENTEFIFADKVYSHLYTQWESKMESLPQGWLPEGVIFKVQFHDEVTELKLKEPKRFPYKDQESYNKPVIEIYDMKDIHTETFFILKEKRKDLKTERREARAAAKAIINNSNTTKQLKDAWPEIKKYVEAFEQPPKTTGKSLAPLISELNQKLNLKG